MAQGRTASIVLTEDDLVKMEEGRPVEYMADNVKVVLSIAGCCDKSAIDEEFSPQDEEPGKHISVGATEKVTTHERTDGPDDEAETEV